MYIIILSLNLKSNDSTLDKFLCSPSFIRPSISHLVVEVPMDAHFWFCLPLEEGVVKLLVVDGQLPHLWTNPLPCLLLERLGVFLVLQCLAHLHHTGRLTKSNNICD